MPPSRGNTNKDPVRGGIREVALAVKVFPTGDCSAVVLQEDCVVKTRCRGHVFTACEGGRDVTLAPSTIPSGYCFPVTADENGMSASCSNRCIVDALGQQRNIRLSPAIVTDGHRRSIVQKQDCMPIPGSGGCDSRALGSLPRLIRRTIRGPRFHHRPCGLDRREGPRSKGW